MFTKKTSKEARTEIYLKERTYLIPPPLQYNDSTSSRFATLPEIEVKTVLGDVKEKLKFPEMDFSGFNKYLAHQS